MLSTFLVPSAAPLTVLDSYSIAEAAASSVAAWLSVH